MNYNKMDKFEEYIFPATFEKKPFSIKIIATNIDDA